MAALSNSFEIYRDAAGEWRWRLLARNGKIIADSAEGFTKRSSCMRNIELVRGVAAGAPVTEQPKQPAS